MQRFALVLSEHLGIPELVETTVTRNDNGSNREWTSPCAASNLIETDDDLVSGLPEGALDREVGGSSLERLSQTRHCGRHSARLAAGELATYR
jgi:hypothetical protein